MVKGSINGKRLLIVRGHFSGVDITSIELKNECFFVGDIFEALTHDLANYDHLLCDYSFSVSGVKELFSKLNQLSELSKDFLISPAFFKELARGIKGKFRDEVRQKEIDKYIQSYPEFFAKVEPDFYKNRFLVISIKKLGDIDPSRLAVFDLNKDYVCFISRTEITGSQLPMTLNVEMKLGDDVESFELKMKGDLKIVKVDIEDGDEVTCYRFNLSEQNEEYQELLQAIELQAKKIDELLGLTGYK